MFLHAPTYQARLRRGMTRHKRGKYSEAAADFQHLLDAGAPMPDLPQVRGVDGWMDGWNWVWGGDCTREKKCVSCRIFWAGPLRAV